MRVAVTIPCFKVKAQILDVLKDIGDHVDRIYVVDDCCPQGSGQYVLDEQSDPRVKVIFHDVNRGVGGATCTGYKAALDEGIDIVVKLDGDGQMDPKLIPRLIKPLQDKKADYCKGTRFHSLKSLRSMPVMRKFGNACLSFISKAASGYWNIMDPTNGFTAINAAALSQLELEKIHERYFFESDMLFRLATIRAVVRDVPMEAKYADEESGLQIRKVLIEFPPLYIKAFFKRLGYNYFLRDFNVASLQFLVGLPLLIFGVVFGVYHWMESIQAASYASTGTVMLSVLPIILGFQLLLSAITFDLNNIPTTPLAVIDD
ncbi:MAG: glycosyltransferase family 2 protein [Halioglobus sp.]|nr:glycosyltransferase family 2 protein [Halioglobus sp.]